MHCIPIINLVLQANLQLADTELNADIGITPVSMTGTVSLIEKPVSIQLDILVQSLDFTLYSHELASFESPAQSLTLLSLSGSVGANATRRAVER